MDDIRSRRYTLKRVTPPEIPVRIQRDAHDAILEFIRSRPPLKSVSIFVKYLLQIQYINITIDLLRCYIRVLN